jgi:molybdenum cofactor cytidylyltransferase
LHVTPYVSRFTFCALRLSMQLSFALSISPSAVVAFVGGGGKTTGMFRLADELVSQGRRVITTTTTRIFAVQLNLSPAHLIAEDATTILQQVPAMLARHGQVLVVERSLPSEGKVAGIDPDLVCRLHDLPEVDAVLVEADGSRMRPFKAPAAHEPVVPDCTTLLVPVVGIEVLGQPLDADHVHRPEIVARLASTRPREPVTPEIVAAVLVHPEGGLKGCPVGAHVALLINKVESDEQLTVARQLAQQIVRTSIDPDGVDAVLIGAIGAQFNCAPTVQFKRVPTGHPIREVHTRTVAVVLAAGGSTRFSQPKQLLDWGGEPLVRHVVKTVLAAAVNQVVVVVGHRAEEVRAALAGLPVIVVVNPNWDYGLSTSVRSGLEAAAPGWGAALFVQADQPLLTAAVINALIQRHRETLAPIVYPSFHGQRGTPTLFDRALAGELLAVEGDRGGSALLPKYRDRAQAVPVDNGGILEDIDTEDDYQRLRHRFSPGA